MAGLRVGYPGLTHTAKMIAEKIGPCKRFCEPFAGLGRVSQYIEAEEIVLNDLSQFSVDYCRERFPDAVVTQEDFMDCIINNDSVETTFLFDPPWARKDYADNPKTFCDRGVGEYYKALADIVPQLKGRWFCAGRAGGGSRSCVTVYFKHYNHFIVKSDRKINGWPIRTKVYYGSNEFENGDVK